MIKLSFTLNLKRILQLFVMFTGGLVLNLHQINAQNGTAGLCIVNGDVLASEIINDTLYLAGSFTSIGEYTGCASLLDAETGRADLSFPKFNGTVNKIIPDNKGGWFVGGDFTKANDIELSGLAHIKPDNTVNKEWIPLIEGYVIDMILIGDTLYFGGRFSSVENNSRNNLASISIKNKELTDLGNHTVSRFKINVLSADSAAGLIYIGGGFTQIGDSARTYLAAINIHTGKVTEWDPHITNEFLDCTRLRGNIGVASMVLSDNNETIYFSGCFDSVGDSSRNYIAAVDTKTGIAKSWHPVVDDNVLTLAKSDDSDLIYLSGDFNFINGIEKRGIAAVDSKTGILSDWHTNLNKAPVYSFAISDSVMYVGGTFQEIRRWHEPGDSIRNYIAALDLATGQTLAWNPDANGFVNTISVSGNGSKVIAGGRFSMIGGELRFHIASIDLHTDKLTSWKPKIGGALWDNKVSTFIYVPQRNSFIFSGYFWSVGSFYTRMYIAEIDKKTGIATAWNPAFDAIINDFALSNDGSIVYAAGGFNSFGGYDRNNIVAFETATGTVTNWNPDINQDVNSITISNKDSLLYVGGSFSTIGDSLRLGIGAIETATGKATAWNPDARLTWDRYADVDYVELSDDNSAIFAMGGFEVIGDSSRINIAQVNTLTGKASGWMPQGFGKVYFAKKHGNLIYIYGLFESSDGNVIPILKAVKETSGEIIPWEHKINYIPFTMSFDDNNRIIYIGSRNLEREDIDAETGLIRIPMPDPVVGINTSYNFSLPSEFALKQNYPNPFNPTTTIEYEIPFARTGHKRFLSCVRLVIYDILGCEVEVLVDKQQYPGCYNVSFDASNLSGGVYICYLRSGNKTISRKMLLIK